MKKKTNYFVDCLGATILMTAQNFEFYRQKAFFSMVGFDPMIIA